ncbi:acyltransferase [Niallia sp. NCCP-28]|uniref:acyltransferase n=1 Tax=Niallia sp. NCCP-28 TaxID=2934712 RepID=UPI00208A107A|nr:acyltransferase [Niallia sp. NCCP-28]GKU80696.1 hypothetical protein NCCP28_00920 [Niallia sp. NCCP-28]
MTTNSYFVHSHAIVESDKIGKDTNIWAFVHILNGASIGANCNICDHCFIENNVLIGNNVTIKSGIYIWDNIVIEDDVFLGPNVVFTNDIFPRSKRSNAKIDEPKLVDTIVKKGASIGANSVIVAGNHIGKYALIGAGSVVTKDIPDYAIAYGNPAKIKGYLCKCTEKLYFSNELAQCNNCKRTYKKRNDIVVELN